MRLALFFLISLIAATVHTAPSILVYHDVDEDYGNAVLEAIDNLWPSCTPEAYTGPAGMTSFNDALNSGSWDIVVIECWLVASNGIDWYDVRATYLNKEAAVFVYNWYWYGSTSGQYECVQAMGIEDLATSSYNDLMETWDPDHPITQDITDWEQYDLYPGGGGSIIRQIKYMWGDTHPVAGWTGTFDFAGICVAGDGRSIVSGYCPAYSFEGVAIWMNILEFMYDEQVLQQETWAGIKSCF